MTGSARPGLSRWGYFWRRALPAYWISLFCLTHLPRLELQGVPGEDKTAHVLAYAVLALLLWQFFAARGRPLGDWFVVKVWGAVAAYAVFDEWTQQFVGRSPELGDWLADMAGATAVLAVLEWRRRATGRRGQTRPG